jgi:ribulose 1,5-bisphosphate synthetase/thiazole synthase
MRVTKALIINFAFALSASIMKSIHMTDIVVRRAVDAAFVGWTAVGSMIRRTSNSVLEDQASRARFRWK